MARSARVQSSQQIALWQMRLKGVYWIPPAIRFGLRICRDIRNECRSSTKSGVAIALATVSRAQQEDMASIAAAISKPARCCARKFRLHEHDLADETLIEVMRNVRDCYQPPCTDDKVVQHLCLQRYLQTPVYRMAWKMRYESAREQQIESMQEKVESEVDLLSEIETRDEYEWLMMRLKYLSPEGLGRLRAIMQSSSIAEAARSLGINEDTLRRWVWQLRQRLKG